MQLRFLDWFRGFGLGFLVAAARGSLRTLIFGEEFNQSIWIFVFFRSTEIDRRLGRGSVGILALKVHLKPLPKHHALDFILQNQDHASSGTMRVGSTMRVPAGPAGKVDAV